MTDLRKDRRSNDCFKTGAEEKELAAGIPNTLSRIGQEFRG